MLPSQGNGGRAPTLGACGDSAPGSNSEQLPQEKARTQGNCPRWREAKRGCGLTDEETFAPIVTPAVAIPAKGRGVYYPAVMKEGG